MDDKIIQWAAELQSLAQAGLYYCHDDFDRERYTRIREISAEMVSARSDIPVGKVRELFCGEVGYQTPKVDTRAAIFRDGKILLVRERTGRWTIPGGWCEYNMSPADSTVKEAKEEAGLNVSVKRLIAVQDRIKHNTPEYIYGVVKIFYLCEAEGGEFSRNIETTESGYFAEDEIPGNLAVEKCNREQIVMCFEALRAGDEWVARFD